MLPDGGEALAITFNCSQWPAVETWGPARRLHVTHARPEVAAGWHRALASGIPIAATAPLDLPSASWSDWSAVAARVRGGLGCEPSLGLVALAVAVQSRPRALHLCAMDFCPARPYATPPVPACYHNWVGERRLALRLVRLARGRGITVAWSQEPPLLAVAAHPDPGAVLDCARRNPAADLDALRHQGDTPAGRAALGTLIACLEATFPQAYRVLWPTPADRAAADLALCLERHLFLPRGKGVRGHPWWLHSPDLQDWTERLEAVVWRITRAMAGLPEARAVRLATALVGPRPHVLGAGQEGVVVSDGIQVVKYLDTWGREPALERTLRRLMSRASTPALPSVTGLLRVGEGLLVRTRFAPFRPFAGDAVPRDWAALLDGLRRTGVAATNLRPENLVWVGAHLRYIDLGRALVPWSGEEDRRMRERAFLTHRFHARPDLPELMRACRNAPGHPAFTDLERFLSSLDARPAPACPSATPVAPLHGRPYSVLIRLCAQDHALGPDIAAHLALALRRHGRVSEVVVVIDHRRAGFPRAFARPDRRRLLAHLHRWVARGVLDRLVESQPESAAHHATLTRWYGVESLVPHAPPSHADNGQGLLANFQGIDACREDRILALDGDLLLWTDGPCLDWTARVDAVFASDPALVFVSPPICRSAAAPPTWSDGRGPYRPCPRASALDRARLRRLLPCHTPQAPDGSLPAWHRRLHGVAPVARLHDADWGFIHPPNSAKHDPGRLREILDRVESGWLPGAQRDRQELVCAPWDGPPRDEPYVFVVCGHRVPSWKVARCLDSLRAQTGPAWGAVLFDDGARVGAAPDPFAAVRADPRFTCVRNRRRQGFLANLTRAVRGFMRRPASVVVIVDLDDCLVGTTVLERLERAYAGGADLTVGSMFRTDKPWAYPPDFANPRSRRGDVWQHLRTFRKALFDALPDGVLRRPDGRYIDLASDWALMVPLVELARAPCHLPDVLYYYDAPAKTPERRAAAARVIASVLAAPTLGARP